MNLRIIILLSYLLSTVTIAAEYYVTPPTTSTRSYVPAISDDKMEQCVKLYNESEWLYKKMNDTSVDSYSKKSVDNYNKMVEQHTRMASTFNTECAEKQSRSACKAAQKLNKEQGFPYQGC
ncbi:MAG: hypothetical protein A6F72_07670 [Cycloclasticus sp. symbiont of Poecilosclerida sp. N]|nr:MAG: hypothetical protein A6F72_07670 [Cycloclasticus sp. symbiont of Poecilosclerida sp. N]